MKRKLALLLMVLLLGVAVAGCISQSEETQATTQTTKETPTTTTQIQEQTTQTEKPKYPIVITDFAGRNVTIEKEPQKIVSLAPSITETLYFLGALEKVVGITKFDDFPENVKEGREIVGGFSDPNIEIIASLKPDLIIATSMHMQYLDQLEKIAPVIVVDPKNMDEIYQSIELLGKVINREEQAKKVIDDMKEKVNEIQKLVADTPKVKVFYVVWNNPLMTAGAGTFINDLIELAGGENIFSDAQSWATVSIEEVLARNPEVIVLTPHCGMSVNDVHDSQLAKTNAAKMGKIVVIQNENILVRPSPRIVEGLEELAKTLHPEAFGGKYPITITDFTGRKVTIKEEPERIISLAPSITETLFFIGAGEKVVGVTKFDDYPPQVVNITKIGGFSDPNIEVIASLKPDLIIGTSMHLKYLDQLEQIAPVIIIDPQNLEGIYKAIEMLGLAVNREEYAKSVITEMKAKVSYITSLVQDKPKVNVFYIVWNNPLMTAGKGTFINDLIQLAGGENIFSDVQGWATVSIEEVLARNPDVIILTPHCGYTPEDLCNTELARTNAVKNGKVVVIQDDNIIVRPGPRIIYGLEELAKFIHPEAFNIEIEPLTCNVEQSANASG